MSDDQLDFVSSLLLRKPTMKTARAVHLKLSFDEFYSLRSPRVAARYLARWCNCATRSRVQAMIEAARTIRRHWEGVLRWFTSGITNGILEASTASFRRPRRKPAAIDQLAISSP